MPTAPKIKASPWVVSKERTLKNSRGTDDFYRSKAWRDCRNAFIKANPLCVHCLADNITKQAEEIDHIIPRTPGVVQPSDFKWDNLQSLCKHHHAIKSNSERKSTGGGRG